MIELVSKKQIINSIDAMIEGMDNAGYSNEANAYGTAALIDAMRLVQKAEVLAVLNVSEIGKEKPNE